MENDGFIVIEGIHKNPNNMDTLDHKTKTVNCPFDKKKDAEVAKTERLKNIDKPD